MASYQRWTLLTTLLVACLCCVLASKSGKSKKSSMSKYVTIISSIDGEYVTVTYSPQNKKALNIEDYSIRYVQCDGSAESFTFDDVQISPGETITVHASSTSSISPSLMVAPSIESFDSAEGTIYFLDTRGEVVAKFPK